MLEEDPLRARNELRSACRQVLAEPMWASVEPGRREALIQELLAVVFGMGPLEQLLADEAINRRSTVNKGGEVWVERGGVMGAGWRGVCQRTTKCEALSIASWGRWGRRIDESSPSVSARLPQGHRVHAVVPPISPDGPVLAIRKFSRKVFSLSQMVEAG